MANEKDVANSEKNEVGEVLASDTDNEEQLVWKDVANSEKNEVGEVLASDTDNEEQLVWRSEAHGEKSWIGSKINGAVTRSGNQNSISDSEPPASIGDER